MKPQNKRVIITQERRLNDKVKVGNQDFILDNVFRSAWNTVQEGTVYSAADNCDLIQGDRVFVHHFVSEGEHKLPFEGGLFSWLEYSQIYSRERDGVMKMLNNYLFVEPIRYDNVKFKNETSGFIMNTKAGSEFVERMGIVSNLSDSCIEAGLKVGDVIIFSKNCEYQIEVNGKKLYRMELRDVITTVPDDIKVTSTKA